MYFALNDLLKPELLRFLEVLIVVPLLTLTRFYLSETSSGKLSAGKKEMVSGLESLSTKAMP